ncbi:MAG: transglutaminase-like domain-containing protein, partial [Leptospirales bacterium]
TKTGDCTEFAHSAALLARLEGIPARVVVGYLASDDLQTPAHIRGMHELRKRIKPLQDFPMEQLYLVTNAHRHAWVQFFLPGFGWIDFEATAFAIPPKPEMNANNMDVLIPMIEEEAAPRTKPEFQFPVGLALRILAIAILGVLALLYLLRLGREWYFYFASRGRTRSALKARFTYLLMQLARDGQPIKAPFQTSLEYAEERAALRPFAATYTTLLFKSNYAPGEEESLWKKLDEQHRAALTELRRPGLFSILRRLISLRSLYY